MKALLIALLLPVLVLAAGYLVGVLRRARADQAARVLRLAVYRKVADDLNENRRSIDGLIARQQARR